MTLQTQMQQAAVLEQQGQQRDAELVYRRILAQNPDQHEALHALGILVLNSGHLEPAAEFLKKATLHAPRNATYLSNLGEIYRRLGRLDDAVAACKKACQIEPKNVHAHYNLGLALQASDPVKAMHAYRKALRINPEHGLAWNNLGALLELLNDENGAKEAYAKAVALNPGHAEAQNNLGAICSGQGELTEARACFEAAIKAAPAFVNAHSNLSALKTYTATDPHLAILEKIYANRATLADAARIQCCFAFGKALDDIGHYDRAFAAYDEGNRLKYAAAPANDTLADALVAEAMETFSPEFFAARADWLNAEKPGQTPIFIVGMPRSGTTLLEQILSSHASVYGAGELGDLHDLITAASLPKAGGTFSTGVAVLNEADIRKIGTDYLHRIGKLSPKSQFITDKMPANFFYLGLLHLALPHAKIIHAMRDPMDSCFSCYSRLFNEGMEFSYDQEALGRYYSRYSRLMDHWRRVLPPDRILDLRYEDMVSDTEAQAKRVLDFVGLPWDSDCLNFHQNKRVVKTASLAQVRVPIYQTSIARWKHFASHLTPLLALVQGCRAMTDEDKAYLKGAVQTQKRVPVSGQKPVRDLHQNGIDLYREGRLADALAVFDQVLADQPGFASAWNSKGFALQDMNRLHEARDCFQQALALTPELAVARLNLAMIQLKLGEWESGWENYEARWTGSAEAHNGTFSTPTCPLPQWTGDENTADDRLLIVTEQGFGDVFQFSRLFDVVLGRFKKVGFVCSQPTLRLMEWSFGDRLVLLSRMPTDCAGWDYYCPLMSLPRALKLRVETIPAPDAYLKVRDRAQAHWKERLDLVAPGQRRIGLAWRGRQAYQYDNRRSIEFSSLLPLLEKYSDVTWVSLQKLAPEDVRPAIPDGVNWLDWMDEVGDFADTAALVANLDLVVSVDSAMVHLAGGLSRPVWMIDRFDNEWRWLAGRADSPWYPTLRIFRQPAFGDWDSVLSDVDAALADRPDRSSGTKRTAKPAKIAPAMTVSPTPRAPAEPAPVAVNVEQAMQVAGQHLAAGRLQQAAQVLQQVLAVQPAHGHALHSLGIVCYQAGQPDKALELITRAVGLMPQHALFQSNLAEMNRQQGRLAEAVHHGQMAVSIDPGMATAHSNLGIAYYDQKDYEKAEACHAVALKLNPRATQSLNNLGSIARARKDLKTAAEFYRQALDLSPDYLEALSNLGAVLVEDDRPDDAIEPLEKALQLRADYPEALCNLGLARLKQEKLELAIALLERSLHVRPGYPEGMLGLAHGLCEKNRLDEALALLRAVVDVVPGKADAWCQLASISLELGEGAQAREAYSRALEIDPALGDALCGLGNLLLEEGAIEESKALLHRAIELDPDSLGARFHLIQAGKVRPGDENFAAMEAMAKDGRKRSRAKVVSLHYALGKGYDDLGEYSKGFPNFLEGARLKRAGISYDAQADADRMQSIADVVDSSFLERLTGGGDPSDQFVFVLGMPRSGTTLTEQIIASHPLVHGAGELRDFMDIVQQGAGPDGANAYPRNLRGLDKKTLGVWGRQYAERVRALAPEAVRITDKMPANYMGLGLISLALPNARIIHVKRNPVDTCVSCFTRLFNRHQDPTYDLAEVGLHYAAYARLMRHWKNVLPDGSFIEVQYEDIVADIETQARRLIDYCGLPWDPVCLDFYKTKRNVRTASVTQVRQPIYTASVDRWRNYEEFLAPLLEALGEFSPVYDGR